MSAYRPIRPLLSILLVTGLALGAGGCDPVGVEDSGLSDASSGSDVNSGSDASAGQDSATGSDAGAGLDSSSGTDAASTSDATTSPRDAGPGGLTVYDIQDESRGNQPAEGSAVSLEGVVVSGIDLRRNTTGFWVQELGGGPYSGIFVFAYDDNTHIPLNTLNVGDLVSVQGTYSEYYDLSEITLTGGSVTGSTSAPAPANPVGIDSNPEQWEGVLVEFAGPCTVTLVRDQYGVVETSCYLLDDDAYEYSLSNGQVLTRIAGMVHEAFSEYRVLPRGPEDLGGSSSSDGGVSSDGGGGGNCGALTYQGECQGDTVRYCWDGEVVVEDCTVEFDSNATCSLLDCTGAECAGYYCVAKPDTACDILDCDLSHGCRSGTCTTSEACDDNHVTSCTGTVLTQCNAFSDLVNELDCASFMGDPEPYTCAENSQSEFACLGTEGEYNCDLSDTPAAECVSGLECSSTTGLGHCQPVGDAGPVADAATTADAASAEDGAVEDGAVEDAGVAPEDSGAAVEDAAAEDI